MPTKTTPADRERRRAIAKEAATIAAAKGKPFKTLPEGTAVRVIEGQLKGRDVSDVTGLSVTKLRAHASGADNAPSGDDLKKFRAFIHDCGHNLVWGRKATAILAAIGAREQKARRAA